LAVLKDMAISKLDIAAKEKLKSTEPQISNLVQRD
jgi:hypothetical protein